MDVFRTRDLHVLNAYLYGRLPYQRTTRSERISVTTSVTIFLPSVLLLRCSFCEILSTCTFSIVLLHWPINLCFVRIHDKS
jgi:hypothetical protein